jgi:hypothetical protein
MKVLVPYRLAHPQQREPNRDADRGRQFNQPMPEAESLDLKWSLTLVDLL